MRKLLLFGLILSAILVVGSALAQDGPTPPDTITVEQPGITPEGIVYDPVNDQLLLSSLTQGTIYAVQFDGTSAPFIEDADLFNTVGIHVDAEGRLLVTNSDRGSFSGSLTGGPGAALAIYDLATRERLVYVDLTDLTDYERHFANDVTVDAEGNAYVTDSLAPVIYRVTPDGEASVFVDDERLSHSLLGPNGIDYHPDSYLLASVPGNRALFKIPLDDPTALSEVVVDSPIMGDGLLLLDLEHLVAVDVMGKVVLLESTDEWATASVIESIPARDATTITARKFEVYTIIAQLNNATAQAYTIQRVELSNLPTPPALETLEMAYQFFDMMTARNFEGLTDIMCPQDLEAFNADAVPEGMSFAKVNCTTDGTFITCTYDLLLNGEVVLADQTVELALTDGLLCTPVG